MTIAFLAVILLALAPVFPGRGIAAAATTGGVSMGVEPLRIQLTLGPAQSSQGEIEVSNESAEAITVRVYIMDRVIKSSGQISFIEPGSNRWSAGRWITLATDSVAVGPKKAAKVGWRVDVPQGVEPGEHSAVIFFEPVRETTEAQHFTFATRIGTVISVEVPGLIRTEGRLIGFTAQQPPVRVNLGPIKTNFKLPFGLFDGGPVPLAAAFENTGNVRVEATSKVEIKTHSGKSVATIDSGEAVTIFPDDSWNVSATWDKPPTFGRFVAEVRVKYADDRPELIATTTFNVFPIRQTMVLLLFAAAIWFIRGGISSLMQRRRRRREARKAAGGESGGMASGSSTQQAPPVQAEAPAQPLLEAPSQTSPEQAPPSPTPAPESPSVAAPTPTPSTLSPRSSKINGVAPTAPQAGPKNGQPSNGSSGSTGIGSRRDRKKK